MMLQYKLPKELQIFSITHNTKNLHKNNILYGHPVFYIQLELRVEDCRDYRHLSSNGSLLILQR